MWWYDDSWEIGYNIQDTTTTTTIVASSWESKVEGTSTDIAFEVTHGHTIAITFTRDLTSYRSQVFDTHGTELDNQAPAKNYSFTATCD
jgi:hypothetical protein